VTPPRPLGEPQSIVAGDTLQFDRTFPNFPASDGWTLSYILSLLGKTNITDVSGANITASGTTFNVNVPASLTGKWPPGKYSWIAYVTGSGSFAGQRFSVAQGQIEVKQNPASENAQIDTRSQAKINLDAINDVLAGRSTHDVQQYRVGHGITGREITKMNVEELLKLRGFWAAIVRQERIAAGETFPSNTVQVHFGQVSN
jgi:hypothetical protein